MSQQTEDEDNIVHVKCRRGGDQLTHGQSCDSLTAERVSLPGAKVASFKCKRCGFAWNIPLGGAFEV